MDLADDTYIAMEWVQVSHFVEILVFCGHTLILLAMNRHPNLYKPQFLSLFVCPSEPKLYRKRTSESSELKKRSKSFV